MGTTLRGILKLSRASLALSPLADGLAGSALALRASGGRVDGGAIVAALTASLALFLFGMAHNDLCDREVDRMRAEGRPLPSGAVSVAAASTFVVVQACIAASAAALAGTAAFILSIVMLSLITTYNARPHHLGLAGPFVLGSIRALNLTLGAAAGGDARAAFPVAIAYGAYIVAVAFIGRMEDGALRPTSRGVAIASGIAALLAFVAVVLELLAGDARTRAVVAALICASGLAGWIASGYFALVREPIVPGLRLSRYVGRCLSGIFLFDATIAAAADDLLISGIILLMFPLARAFVRAFPPS